mmetsp:Transcript_53352/g.88491  ORF Transcript_53352/g.88491 Transcript_53352/m.88491 type:complete len:135 (+) Transcript_53352:143-547(+)|eukprot:CAMPEP_0202685588 /NCGR_PEP_ID=MMETSP1385-20130828/1392_1 /ASSEMBLY_ACC=CAM_ASM_000861 /TAXON_ID=933848 /ORGANISM="Elphidium margaritaceum" /LENGTH=134 /DNA_ID=CAMNT_0049339983 /DNA_START=137 /DNA_END=541 /DNA_ORIENTATION=-
MTSSDANKSGELPERTGASGSGSKLYIQMLDRGSDEMASDMNKCLNLFLVFIAFVLLYAFYVAFGYAWLTAMSELGEDLNWAFFGIFLSVAGGMSTGVAVSMKSQRIGWWEQLTPQQAKRARDKRGTFCGITVY